jgi:hypothetical protein
MVCGQRFRLAGDHRVELVNVQEILDDPYRARANVKDILV